jgi:uncharacterized protein YxjI
MTDWLSEDRFVIDQLIKPMVNLYRISAGPTPIAFVRQKRMAIKEDIRFYADESETRELWRIKARSMMEFSGRYDVTTPEGETILDVAGQELAIAQERSPAVAILRRVIDVVPYGDFVPIPFHFTIDAGERHIGDLNRRLGFRDTYDLDVSGDVERTIDRRLAITLGIALDALQSR